MAEFSVATAVAVTGTALLVTPMSAEGFALIAGAAAEYGVSVSRIVEGAENIYYAASDTAGVGVNLLRNELSGALGESGAQIYDIAEPVLTAGLVYVLPYAMTYLPQDGDSGSGGSSNPAPQNAAKNNGAAGGNAAGGNSSIPDKAKQIANEVKNNHGNPPTGYKGGRIYNNIPLEDGAQKLPEGVNYREYDVNPYVKG